jgi:DNA-binding transcriptional LysR family regulator
VRAAGAGAGRGAGSETGIGAGSETGIGAGPGLHANAPGQGLSNRSKYAYSFAMNMDRRARLAALRSTVDLRHLRYFQAVADTLHFGRAAKRLGISQPPLSVQIQRLEEALGVTLFDRTSRRVALTDAGTVLAASVERVFQSVDGALDATLRAAEGETGRLAVAFASSVMFQTLPAWIRAFRDRYPEVTLELRELPTGLQLAALEAGELDVGFVREPPETPGVALETVMREPLVVAVSAAHRLARAQAAGAPLSLELLGSLAADPFVLFPEELAPGLHAQVMDLCARAGFAPRVVQASRELYTTVSLVEAGVGVTVVPASIRKMGWAGVRYLPVEGVETRIDMAWRSEVSRPVVGSFLGLVRGELARKGDEPAAATSA